MSPHFRAVRVLNHVGFFCRRQLRCCALGGSRRGFSRRAAAVHCAHGAPTSHTQILAFPRYPEEENLEAVQISNCEMLRPTVRTTHNALSAVIVSISSVSLDFRFWPRPRLVLFSNGGKDVFPMRGCGGACMH